MSFKLKPGCLHSSVVLLLSSDTKLWGCSGEQVCVDLSAGSVTPVVWLIPVPEGLALLPAWTLLACSTSPSPVSLCTQSECHSQNVPTTHPCALCWRCQN